MRKLTVLLSSLLLLQQVRGQNKQVSAAGSYYNDTASALYFNSLQETLPLYNGRVFYGYPGIHEHAFYPATGWHNGSVLFDGIWYHNMSIMYDTYMDEVIILHPTSTPVRLISDRIQQFRFENFHFERLGPYTYSGLKNGFYQRMVSGPVTVYVKRSKKIEENIVDLTLERKFVITDQYFAVKEGIYTPIYKQKSMLELVKSKRQGVVQHLKQQNLKFKKDREKAIVEMAEFYNQSSN